MKIVYASRMGHVEEIVSKLGYTDAVKIVKGDEKVEGEFVLFTYSDLVGETPAIVESFLANNPGLKAVVGSGSKARHPETFNFGAIKVGQKYNVPVLATLDLSGTDAELEAIKKEIAAL